MKNQKPAERDGLIHEFGILMQPLETLARQDDAPGATQYRVAVAKVQAGDAAWRQRAKQFTTFAPDLSFTQEYNDISHVPERLLARVRGVIDDPKLTEDPEGFHSQFNGVGSGGQHPLL